MVDGLHRHAFEAEVLGEFTDGDRQLIHRDGSVEVVDRLDRDELYRVLEAFAPSGT